MFRSPSRLSELARSEIAESLNECLADGLDLHSQVKVAHWNVKGPLFAALHPLFDTLASVLAARTDAIAERAVILGGRAYGTARHVAKTSRILDYPQDTARDLEHARLLVERLEAYLMGLRDARERVAHHGDGDSADLLAGTIAELEKQGWFLRATVEH